jgi:HKD family nuclease
LSTKGALSISNISSIATIKNLDIDSTKTIFFPSTYTEEEKNMSCFITNSSQGELSERIKTLISASRELKFLVGFFYFSGLRELYEGLKNNQNVIMKVLVGLNVDRTNYGLIEYADPEISRSDNERRQIFFESIKRSINCDYFDNKDFYEQARFFIELIKSNRLIIRKTFEPNHSKLYIFKLDQSQIGRNALFITGSSNLTSAGLSSQNEFNVEISDYGVERAEEYYDNLWNSGVIITEEDAIRLRFIELLQKETLIRELTPYEAYVLVLKNYLETFNQSDRKEDVDSILNRAKFFPYRYQTDAIKQALKIIEANNGVIIADVVGLGKTVIACAVAVLLKKRGIVLCPPGLIGERGVQG